MSRASEPSAPSIFGRPMVPNGRASWKLDVGSFDAFIDMRHRGAFAGLRGFWVCAADSVGAAAVAIEEKVRELVLSLAPLLDDAAKRELVKAAGIGLEHFPQCKEPLAETVESTAVRMHNWTMTVPFGLAPDNPDAFRITETAALSERDKKSLLMWARAALWALGQEPERKGEAESEAEPLP